MLIGKTDDARIRRWRPVVRPAQAAGAQPVEHRAFHRRQQQRHRRGGRGRADPGRHRHRYRRLDPRPGGAVRHRRHQADLWAGQPRRRRAGRLQLDHIGPMAWTAEDCALMLQALAGHDPRDPASAVAADPRLHAPRSAAASRACRIGVIHHFHEVDHKVSDGTQRGIDRGDRDVARSRRRDPRGAAVAACRIGRPAAR